MSICLSLNVLTEPELTKTHDTIPLGWCKKDVTPLLKHLSYIFLALTHRYGIGSQQCVNNHTLQGQPSATQSILSCENNMMSTLAVCHSCQSAMPGWQQNISWCHLQLSLTPISWADFWSADNPISTEWRQMLKTILSLEVQCDFEGSCWPFQKKQGVQRTTTPLSP